MMRIYQFLFAAIILVVSYHTASASTDSPEMIVVRNDVGLLPIHDIDTTSIAIVNIGIDETSSFHEYCLKYAFADIYNTTNRKFSQSVLKEILSHDVIIIGVFSAQKWVRSTIAQFSGYKNIVPVLFIPISDINKLGKPIQGFPTIAIVNGNTSLHRVYAAQGLFGGTDISGHIPIDIPHIAQRGSGITLNKTRLGFSSPKDCGMNDSLEIRIDSLVSIGLRTHAFPGCQVLVAKDGNIIFDRSYGHLCYTDSASVKQSSIYDLASVSKAAGTLVGIMKAFDQGLFHLDDPVSDYIPNLRHTDKADITIRDLLYHESGMPAALGMNAIMMVTDSISSCKYMRRDITASQPSSRFPIEIAKGLFVGKETLDTIMSRIYNAKLRPTKRYNYSCLNFALLMDIEQRLTGIDHDKYVNDNIFAPLGAYHTGYRPLTFYHISDIAATENDTIARKQIIRGYVHDEMAAMSGGVQGNAGLFSNAEDLAKLCQMWLNGGMYGGKQILSSETVRLFTTDKSPSCRRGLGFDKPDVDNPSASPVPPEASPATFGHIGFTGTCFWVDPKYNLIYIFLSNRVNPTRNNPAFTDLNIRPAILHAIYQSL